MTTTRPMSRSGSMSRRAPLLCGWRHTVCFQRAARVSLRSRFAWRSRRSSSASTHMSCCTHRSLLPWSYSKGRQSNYSARMYGFYSQEKWQEVAAGHPASESFLVWHRSREYDDQTGGPKYRGGNTSRLPQKPRLLLAAFGKSSPMVTGATSA